MRGAMAALSLVVLVGCGGSPAPVDPTAPLSRVDPSPSALSAPERAYFSRLYGQGNPYLDRMSDDELLAAADYACVNRIEGDVPSEASVAVFAQTYADRAIFLVERERLEPAVGLTATFAEIIDAARDTGLCDHPTRR